MPPPAGRNLCEHPGVASDGIFIRPAEEGDRRSLAELLAVVAAERDGIATEPPVDVERLISGDTGAGVDDVRDRLGGFAAHYDGDLITGAAAACRVGQQVA